MVGILELEFVVEYLIDDWQMLLHLDGVSSLGIDVLMASDEVSIVNYW